MIKEFFESEELRPALGLALGGGAVKGAAHMGVLQAFQEADLRPDFIAGTSIGAMVGTLYAFGKTPKQIVELASDMKWLDISSYTFSRFGLLTNKAIREIMVDQIGDVNLEDSPIPLAIVAADISTGERVVFKNGSAAKAVMASTCIPGIFVPVDYQDRKLVDGGIVEHVPTSSLSQMGADFVVGVDLSGGESLRPPTGIVGVILNAIEIAVRHQARLHTSQADVLIQLNVRDYGKPGAQNVNRLFQTGYDRAKEYIPEIKEGLKDQEPSTVEVLSHKIKAWRSRD